MVATLLVPIHIAVLIGVVLSLLLVGINSASATRVVALEPVGPGRWRRGTVPSALPPGQVTVIDIEGSGAFVSVAGLVSRLPAPAPQAERSVVVMRLHGHLRTNLTFVKALERYAGDVQAAGGAVFLCGLQPAAITQLRSAGLPDSIVLIPEGDELDGSLGEAFEGANAWLGAESPPA